MRTSRMPPWRPTRFTAPQLEERRLKAAELLGRGRLSQAEIARRLGVSRASVSHWAGVLAQEGRRGLRRHPHPGRPRQLTVAHWGQLAPVLVRGAVAAGFETERWTLRRLAVVVERALERRYHPRSLGRVLRGHGWTPQRPIPQGREPNDALVDAWLKRDWPRITRGLAARGASWPSWTRRVTRFGPA